MNRIPIARIVLAIIFFGFVFSPIFIKRMAARREAEKSKLDVQTSLARHGFYLEEVSRAAGINFVHHGPTLDSKLEPIMPQVASMGASVSIVDFDRDGWAEELPQLREHFDTFGDKLPAQLASQLDALAARLES